MAQIRKIQVRKPFTEQYTLLIESDLMAVNAIMKSKTRIRWNVQFINITDEALEFRLILLEQSLLEANNPLVQEVANLTSTFSKMYNELHLITDHHGTIKEVCNLPAILGKWQQVKQELQQIADHSPEIKNVVLMNDSIFQNKSNLIATLQRSEFFLLYFNNIFNNILPYNDVNFIMGNVLNTTNLNWEKKITPVQSAGKDIMNLELESKPVFMPKDFINRAYSQFKDKLDPGRINPKISETGFYTIDVTRGKVLKASLKREEFADPELLFAKLEYQFIADELEKKQEELQLTEAVSEAV